MSLRQAELEQQHSSASSACPAPWPERLFVCLSDGQGAAFLPEGERHCTTPARSPKPTLGRFQHLPGLNEMGYFYSCVSIKMQEAQENPHSPYPRFVCSFQTVQITRASIIRESDIQHRFNASKCTVGKSKSGQVSKCKCLINPAGSPGSLVLRTW